MTCSHPDDHSLRVTRDPAGYNNFNVSMQGSSPYPNNDQPTFQLYGRVYVLLGQHKQHFHSGSVVPINNNNNNNKNDDNNNDNNDNDNDNDGNNAAANQVVQVTTTTLLRGLGATLSVGDVNSDGHLDLLIGCQHDNNSRGSLHGLVASTDRRDQRNINIDQPNQTGTHTTSVSFAPVLPTSV